jgi:hypothetical protein
LQGAPVSQERAAADLQRLIREQIAPETWQRQGILISAVGDELIVRQAPGVQRQVARLLRKMAVLAPRNPPAAEPTMPSEKMDNDPFEIGSAPAQPEAPAGK